jgi:uncharacterized SAM-binding protein YcdF (DUF218 family)
MHMLRAAGAFRKAGFEVIAVPADFHTGWDESYVSALWLADNLRNSDAALHEWLGIAIIAMLYTAREAGYETGPRSGPWP